MGTTRIKCNHNGTETEAVFYVTNVQGTKVILGLWLCIDLGLIVSKCKNVQIAETTALTLIENTQENVDTGSTLPPVPLDPKISETNAKAHIMQLYRDLFDGVGTIKNAVIHLDVKPETTPLICSPRQIPDALKRLIES